MPSSRNKYYKPQFRNRIESIAESGLGSFVDLAATQSHEASAQKIADQRVQILIDLQLHTFGGRPEVAARRPAPVQACFLIYPGTSGAPWIDYLFADSAVVPGEQAEFYSEKLVYMPVTYQVNFYPPLDLPEHIALPVCDNRQDRPFVFANFNKITKLDPASWEVWMAILRRVPQSELVLLSPSKKRAGNFTVARLLAEAEARGVAASRISFAPRIKKKPYLERMAEADLFLDTFVYNAHSTATDALRGGLPVITLVDGSGRFAGRVAGGLLHTMELDFLITYTRTEFEDLAVRLAKAHIAGGFGCRGRRESIAGEKDGKGGGKQATDPLFWLRSKLVASLGELAPRRGEQEQYDELVNGRLHAQSSPHIDARHIEGESVALFDTARYTEEFERALLAMYELYAEGKRQHLIVERKRKK